MEFDLFQIKKIDEFLCIFRQKFRDGRTGFLKMSTFNNMLVLPFDEAKCASANSCPVTFTAGDIRVNLVWDILAHSAYFIIPLINSIN
jgi:hypothetical protein